MSAQQVVDIFDWNPHVAHSVHEQRRTKAGNELPGRHKETFVSFSLEIEDHRFPEDFLSAHLAESNSAEQLAIKRAIAAGCDVAYTFGISCPGDSGFELDANLIEAIRATGASLSFYIYGF